MAKHASSPLIDDFLKLLDDPSKNENDVQGFLERNSELLPMPFMLNHDLHFGMVLSKFKLGVDLVTDFVYLTKSSVRWNVVLVEIESPKKRIFTNELPVVNSGEFSRAHAQVRSWKEYLRRHSEEFLSRLAPLRVPLGQNPVDFKYVLVMGRRDEIKTQAHRDRIASIEKKDFELLTYDSLISHYQEGRPFKKNIIAYREGRFHFKYLHTEPDHLFSDLTPEHICLTKSQEQWLTDQGFEIDRWNAGESLNLNGRKVFNDNNFGRLLAP